MKSYFDKIALKLDPTSKKTVSSDTSDRSGEVKSFPIIDITLEGAILQFPRPKISSSLSSRDFEFRRTPSEVLVITVGRVEIFLDETDSGCIHRFSELLERKAEEFMCTCFGSDFFGGMSKHFYDWVCGDKPDSSIRSLKLLESSMAEFSIPLLLLNVHGLSAYVCSSYKSNSTIHEMLENVNVTAEDVLIGEKRLLSNVSITALIFSNLTAQGLNYVHNCKFRFDVFTSPISLTLDLNVSF
jgi:hypothetical protein